MTPTSGIIKMTDMSGNKIEDLTKKKEQLAIFRGIQSFIKDFRYENIYSFWGIV